MATLSIDSKLPIHIKNSIATKIMLVVFLFYFVITLTLTAIHIYAEIQSTHEKVLIRLQQLEETFSPALSGALWDVNEELINSTLKGMLKNPILQGVKIEDAKQQQILNGAGIFTNSEGASIQWGPDKDEFVDIIEKPYFDLLSYQFKIVFKNEEKKEVHLGYCTVYSSINNVLQEVQLSILFIVVNAVLKTIALWFIYLLVSRRMLSSPLFQLTEATRKISLDNLEHFKLNVKTSGRNEMKVLEEAFHYMVKNLLSARKRLEANLKTAKRLSSEGRKISSCFSNHKLSEQVTRSFAKIAGKDIGASVVLFEKPLEVYTHALDEASAQPLTQVKLPIFDTKEDQIVGEVHFQGFSTIEEQEELLPLFQALLVNIANTRRNIVMVQELKEKAQDLEKSNQALSKLDQMKDEFLANTSHELRTPLNGIIGLSEGMIDGIAGELAPAQTQQLSMIIRSAKSLSNLINDLLDFSKISNQELRLEVSELSFHHVLDIMLTFFTPLIDEKGLKLATEVPDHLPLIYADENRLQQILFNLLGNALKFTAQGKITIQVENQDETIKISIGDTGIGIPLESQDTIFNPFEQVRSAQSMQPSGTGLGLSISKQLVELHGGTMSVKSIKGIGSMFSFTLPTSKSSQVNPQPSKKLSTVTARFPEIKFSAPDQVIELPYPVNKTNQRDEHILIVDDDQTNLQVIKNFLDLNGFNISLALDGYEALEIIHNDKPDLVLLDLMMPGLNGYDTCRIIREKESLANLPIIMLTARDQVWDLVKGFEVGANDYMIKPFHKEELLARVNTHLAAKQAVEQLQSIEKLQMEIDHRKDKEKALSSSHRRLLKVLDVADSALITINDKMNIIFINQAAEQLLGQSSENSFEQPIQSFLSVESYKKIIDITSRHQMSKSDQVARVEISVRKKDGKEQTYQSLFIKQQIDDEFIFTMIMPTIQDSQTLSTTRLLLPDINFNNMADPSAERYDPRSSAVVEALLEVGPLMKASNNDLMFDLRYFSMAFDNMNDKLLQNKTGKRIRTVLVETMHAALSYWESWEGKTKVDLAESSKIWRVYLDVGTYRTRTLDKYLSVNTLPRRPKWKEVIKTAFYVLSNVPNNKPQRQRLIDCLKKLYQMLNEVT